MRFAHEFDILLKIIKSGPAHPALRLIQVIEQLIVEPEDDILAKSKLNFSNVHVRYSSIFVILAVNNEEFLPLFKEHNSLLRGVLRYEVFDAPARS